MEELEKQALKVMEMVKGFKGTNLDEAAKNLVHKLIVEPLTKKKKKKPKDAAKGAKTKVRDGSGVKKPRKSKKGDSTTEQTEWARRLHALHAQ